VCGAVALDDAESEDGFGGFEEAPEGSTAEAPRSEGNDVKDSAMVSTSESQWHRLPLTKQAAGSAQDIFFSSKAAFLAQVHCNISWPHSRLVRKLLDHEFACQSLSRITCGAYID
jgi:hypothetical protein